MPTLEKRIQSFINLGNWFGDLALALDDKSHPNHDFAFELKEQAANNNAWFTRESLLTTWNSYSEMLNESSLRKFASKYEIKENNSKTIAIIAAGNIPAVGFHDLMCVLLSGNKALIKLSSDDKVLMKSIVSFLIKDVEEWQNSITIAEGLLKGFDAVIATGSNNTSRYFDYYFSKYPHIIRKNRNGIAVLTGEESDEEISLFGKDIFSYFGLGCRNVSSIYIPENYDFKDLYKPLESYKQIIDHHKYLNNYEYHKSIYLINRDKFFDNGFLMLREQENYSSPLSVMHFQYYSSLDEVEKIISSKMDQIQCVLSHKKGFANSIPLGSSQFPKIDDFADGVDTMKFLTSLS